MTEDVRVVVTGSGPDGREGMLLRDDRVRPLVMGEMKYYGVWGWDGRPSLPYACTNPYDQRSVFPDPDEDGLRVSVTVLPPGAGVKQSDGSGQLETAASAEWKRLSDAQPYGGSDEEGMHATGSVDILMIASGSITLELSGGESTTLRPGDVCVQNGARHAWRNYGTEPCVMLGVLISAPSSSDDHS